jgi:hypothetical protein
VIYHGFDKEAFLGNPTQLTAEMQRKLDATRGALRLLLFVSDYTYYLIRALPLLRTAISPRMTRLIITSNMFRNNTSSSYDTDFGAKLIRKLGVCDEVVELGPVPYWSLRRSC